MDFIISKKENSLIHYIGFNNVEISDDIGLTSSTTPYTAVDAIKTTLAFLQIVTELRKLEKLWRELNHVELVI